MSHLVLFDIDGTLTDTHAVDGACYKEAYREQFGRSIHGALWEDATEVTDSGVLYELFQNHFDRLPRTYELRALQDALVQHFEAAWERDRDAFRPVPGAAELLLGLSQSDRFRCATATGCWKRSAEFKLKMAGLGDFGFPMGCSDDALRRVEITSTAMERARAHYRVGRFDRATLVGDGLWDLRTARSLKLRFIGIDVHGQGTFEGEDVDVLPDLSDRNAFLALLQAT